jgi:RHS repeat-associated protein
VDCFGSPFTFTGELLDANALLYLRARYYNPVLGVFTALDPVENGNRYQYVGGNTVNLVDPSGMLAGLLRMWDPCWRQGSETCSECLDRELDSIIPSGGDIVFYGPYYYEALQRCQNVCPPWGGATPTPPGNPCDPTRLPPISDILATFSGTADLTASNYSWWVGSIPNVKISFYGTRALRDQSVTAPSQLPAQEARDICCGQGAVYIGGGSYRCNMQQEELQTLCSNPTAPENFMPPWVPPGRCGTYPYLANETCAVPGQTGAVLPDVGIAGRYIGRMFAYVIPASGDYSQGVALYLNDAGKGVEFQDRQIDIYAGILDESSLPTENGMWLNIYNTSENTVCLLASSAVLEDYSPPR